MSTPEEIVAAVGGEDPFKTLPTRFILERSTFTSLEDEMKARIAVDLMILQANAHGFDVSQWDDESTRQRIIEVREPSWGRNTEPPHWRGHIWEPWDMRPS